MQKVLKQPCSKNSHGAFGESSLRSPNRLMLEKPWPVAVRVFPSSSSIAVAGAKPWRVLIHPVIAYVRMSLIVELKLVSDCLLQAPEMFGHGFYCQTCIGSCIAEAWNILKGCYYCMHLLIVLPVPSVNLFNIKLQQFSQLGLNNQTLF